MTDDDDDWLEAETRKNKHAPQKRGIILSKVRVATVFGLQPKTVDRMIREGAPIISKGAARTAWLVNSAAFFDWYVDRQVADAIADGEINTYDDAKKRDKLAQARLRELQIATREGQLCEIDDVKIYLERKFGMMRSRILSIPTQVAGLTYEQRNQLESAIQDVLTAISEHQVDPDWIKDDPTG